MIGGKINANVYALFLPSNKKVSSRYKSADHGGRPTLKKILAMIVRITSRFLLHQNNNNNQMNGCCSSAPQQQQRSIQCLCKDPCNKPAVTEACKCVPCECNPYEKLTSLSKCECKPCDKSCSEPVTTRACVCNPCECKPCDKPALKQSCRCDRDCMCTPNCQCSACSCITTCQCAPCSC